VLRFYDRHFENRICKKKREMIVMRKVLLASAMMCAVASQAVADIKVG